MNHVHDSHETTPVEDAWYKLCIVAGKPLSDALGDYFGAVFKQIADQRIEHSTVKLDGKTICTYPVVPEGDVPEWDVLYRQFIDHKGSWLQSVLDVIKPAYESLRSELTRRVAEDTADKDRRIAELEKRRTYVDTWPTTAAEWESLKQQLATATAEVERLNVLIQATAEAWLSLEPGVAWEGAIDAAMKAAVNEIKKLRQQLADATRPVEGVEELVELTCKESFASFDAVSWLSVKSLMANAAKKAIQRERAARVAAEAERDELREFVRTRYLETRTGSGVCKPREHGPVTDAQFAEAFAAYRAEKGKVAK